MKTIDIPLNNPKVRILIYRGFKALKSHDLNRASLNFSQAMFLDFGNIEARIGLYLTDIAYDFPDKADIFYNLYTILIDNAKRSEKQKIQSQILEAIKLFDSQISLNDTTEEDDDNKDAQELYGILYADFKRLCKTNGFREVFEDLIVSTKIIFTQKEDFYEFLQNLALNGFIDLALSYVEDLLIFNGSSEIVIKKFLENGAKN